MFSIVATFDDGNELDLRVADILQKYGLSAIFFIPSNTKLSEIDIIELHKNNYIAGHTRTHPADLKLLSDEELENEIKGNKEDLEKIIKEEIDFFCYPKGHYDKRVIEAVKKAGYKYARTTVIGDDDGNDTDWRMKLKVDCHIGYPVGRKGQDKDWVKDGLEKARLRKKQDKPFMAMAHSEEIDRYNQWEQFEEFLKELVKIKDE